MRDLTIEDVEAACLGGGVFACGGGGWMNHGLENGQVAVGLGRPKLATIDDIEQDGVIITMSAIGAPALDTWEMWPRDYIKAFELVRDAVEEPVVGIMIAQNGYSSTVNAWMPAAAHDIPVVDAAGDIRAHPTIKLGAMGYAADPNFQTVQAVVGGVRAEGAYLEVLARGNPFKTANILRTSSVESGGFIASARLPLPVADIRKRAALGGVTKALEVGHAIIANREKSPATLRDAIAGATNGHLVGTGKVSTASLKTEGGFDFATFVVASDQGAITVHTLNEYMAVDIDNERISTYPDTIVILGESDGMAKPASQICEGDTVSVMCAKANDLPLGAGTIDPVAIRDVESLMGLDFMPYIPALDDIKQEAAFG